MATDNELKLLLTIQYAGDKAFAALSKDLGGAEKQASAAAGALGTVGKSAGGLGGLLAAPGKALGGLVSGFGALGLAGLGVGTAIGVVQSAVSGLIGPAMDAQTVSAQLESVLASTGGKAGVTKAAVEALSGSLSKVTKFEDEAITSAQSLLLTFTNVGEDVFPQATETILNMSEALGQDLKSSAMQVGKALNDPIAGIGALRRVGVQLSDEQEELVKSMVAVGDVSGAQGVILKELETQFGGVARAAGKTLPGQLTILQNQFGNIMEVIGGPVIGGLSELLKMVMPLVDAFGEWLPGALDALMTALQPVFDFIGGFLIPQLTDLGQIVMDVFSGDFQAAVDVLQTSIMPRVQEFGENILDWIGEMIPPLIEQIGLWAQEFVAWVAPLIPPLLVELGVMAGRLFAWVAEQAPVFLKALIGEWIPAFIGWVVPLIPPLLLELGKIVVGIGGWILGTAVPELLKFALNMGRAIIDGVLQALAPLGEEIGRELAAVGPRMRNAGAALAGQIRDGFLSIPIVASVRNVVGQISDLLPHSLAKVGPLSRPIGWGRYLTEGMAGAGDLLVSITARTVQDLVREYRNGMEDVQAALQATGAIAEDVFGPEGTVVSALDATGEALDGLALDATAAAGDITSALSGVASGVAGAVARTSQEMAALLNQRGNSAGLFQNVLGPMGPPTSTLPENIVPAPDPAAGGGVPGSGRDASGNIITDPSAPGFAWDKFNFARNTGGLPQFANGGVMPGYGSGHRLALVQPGEGVFTPEQMAALGAGRGGGASGATVVLEMDGVVLGRVLVPYLAPAQRRLARLEGL